MARRAPGIRPIAASLPLLALAALAWADPSAAPGAEELLASLPPELAARLETDHVVMLQEFAAGEAHGGMIHALVIFERPRNEVIRYLIQAPRQTEFRPELEEARLVEDFEDGQVVDYELRMLLMRIHYRARHSWDFEKGLVWWSLDPGFDNDIAQLEGRWEVHALGVDRSLARFGTKIDVGPALPAFLQDLATRTKLPESMHHVRRWVDSGGTYRP